MTRLGAIASKLIVLCALVALTALVVPADGQQPTPSSPADGHTVHVTAPHVVEGEIMGPYHHYCKVLSPEPVIECLCYGSSEPGAIPRARGGSHSPSQAPSLFNRSRISRTQRVSQASIGASKCWRWWMRIDRLTSLRSLRRVDARMTAW